ncbi:MAG TPA: ATP synthase F0 subunit C [Bryobacteraceae bacterium]|jgi:F-type H+-transporting ATPase subunit c
MTKKLFFVVMLLLLGSCVLCAQTPGNAAAAATQWNPLAAGLSMAIASGLCGIGQGKAIASAVEGMGRNPGAAGAIQLAMLIGLAFIESLALYTLLIVFVFVR